jgi:hypothetical protein
MIYRNSPEVHKLLFAADECLHLPIYLTLAEYRQTSTERTLKSMFQAFALVGWLLLQQPVSSSLEALSKSRMKRFEKAQNE